MQISFMPSIATQRQETSAGLNVRIVIRKREGLTSARRCSVP